MCFRCMIRQQQQRTVDGGMFVHDALYSSSFSHFVPFPPYISSFFLLKQAAVPGKTVALLVQFNFLLNSVVQFVLPDLSNFVVLNAMLSRFTTLTFYRCLCKNAVGRCWSLFWLLTFVSVLICSKNSIYFVSKNLPETKGLTLEAI